MKLKSVLLLSTLAWLMMLVSVDAQPPAFIQNGAIRITLGNGVNNQGPWTIVGMAPVKALWRDIVWFGEYEYLSVVGPPPAPIGGPWPAPGLVRLWGPGVPRALVGFGATWYTITIGPVIVGGVPVTVRKTVTLGPGAAWWARISYAITPAVGMNQLWLYYSIDYCDGPVWGNPRDNMWSFAPNMFEPLSRQVPPTPMPTPPGGGLRVDTKGTGVGVMMSWLPAGVGGFPVTRYAGRWFNGLYDNWPNGIPLGEQDDDGAFAINLGAVGVGGVLVNQLYVGGIFGDPPEPLPYEPPIPPVPLTAAFDMIAPVSPQTLEGNHIVKKIWPIAGKTVTFNASSSFDLNTTHTITKYVWNFGDGTPPVTTTTPTITHVYQQVQSNVTVSLTVSNNVGETAHAEHLFDVAPVASFKIWTDKTTYKIGETMKVYVRVKNPSFTPLPVRAKIFLKLPSGALYGPLLDLTTTLPALFDSGDVLWQSFTIPTAPKGNYAWVAQLINPTTGALISQDTRNWQLT